MLENYEINKAIEDFSLRVDELEHAIDIDNLKEKLKEKEELMNNPSFWNDQNTSSKVLKEIKSIKDNLDSLKTIKEHIEELELYFEMHKSKEADLGEEIENLINETAKILSDFEVLTLLSKEYDECDAIVDMHPGAGGTESQDWCEMLYRMYQRYAERNGFDFEVLDYLDGEEAGIKSVSFIIKGSKAYGYMKGEQGVHRLVRISPFDSNARRHTSFCAVTVVPSVDKDIDIVVLPSDIRIDTYRASGAGGQYINKTDSAIRITHLKTGIVVTCQNQRSQIQNREVAMRILKSKLYKLEQEAQDKKIKEISGDVSDNSFGSQIRSYVFHPYSMIKDHRTNYEVFNTNAVMDGDIGGFINAFLKSPFNNK